MKQLQPAAWMRLLLGGLFLWSGFLKLLDPWQNFQAVIEAYRLVQGAPAQWIAQIFPWIEAIGGLFLVLGLYIPFAAAALWALNMSFIAALGAAVVRKLPIHDCGCFGDAFSLPPPLMLVLDTALWFGFGSLFLWKENAAKLSLDEFYATRRQK